MSKSDLEKAFTVPRDPEVISQEYKDLCAMVGDKSYHVEVLKSEIIQLNNRLFELNKEHSASIKMNAVKPQASEPAQESVEKTPQDRLEASSEATA